jgi:transcriptional regulator with XRE-family HTH domain
MEMMKIFVYNMKKYRKKRQLSQMKLAEMINTSTSYIGEIEINSKVPSMEMVEKISKALSVEPFRLFVDNRNDAAVSTDISYLSALSPPERQDLTERLVALIANNVEQLLQPENSPRP